MGLIERTELQTYRMTHGHNRQVENEVLVPLDLSTLAFNHVTHDLELAIFSTSH